MNQNIQVQLRAAKIPWLGWLALHHWYVIHEPSARPERWEIWQTPNLGANSWGHLHQNLMAWDSGVGNGPSWLVREWVGPSATDLAGILRASPDTYHHTHKYFYFPGPNSNTYVQWVLKQSGSPHLLGWRAVGKWLA
jgi:hypothetical protein